MDRTSALMMTGQYKQLVADSRSFYQVSEKINRMMNDLTKQINSPVGAEDRHSLTFATSGLASEMDWLESLLIRIRRTIIEIDEMVGRMRVSDTNVASELVKIAKELSAKQIEAEMLWQKVASQFGEKLAIRAHSDMLRQAASYSDDTRLNPDGSLWVNEFMSLMMEGFEKKMRLMSADY